MARLDDASFPPLSLRQWGALLAQTLTTARDATASVDDAGQLTLRWPDGRAVAINLDRYAAQVTAGRPLAAVAAALDGMLREILTLPPLAAVAHQVWPHLGVGPLGPQALTRPVWGPLVDQLMVDTARYFRSVAADEVAAAGLDAAALWARADARRAAEAPPPSDLFPLPDGRSAQLWAEQATAADAAWAAAQRVPTAAVSLPCVEFAILLPDPTPAEIGALLAAGRLLQPPAPYHVLYPGVLITRHGRVIGAFAPDGTWTVAPAKGGPA